MEGKASKSPIAYLKGLNVETDRRHDRRALTTEEVKKLLETAQKGPFHHKMSGPERRLLYLLALETGLRWSELYSLTKTSFNLDHDPPTIKVKASFSKRKREDILPLRPLMAIELRIYLARKMPASKAFPMWKNGGFKMLREDIEAAEIPYVDEQGRYADFHSLRHTFLSNLANSGVHPKVAQSLARHSDINMTLSRYTHTVVESQSKAVNALPDFSFLEKKADDQFGSQKHGTAEYSAEFTGFYGSQEDHMGLHETQGDDAEERDIDDVTFSPANGNVDEETTSNVIKMEQVKGLEPSTFSLGSCNAVLITLYISQAYDFLKFDLAFSLAVLGRTDETN